MARFSFLPNLLAAAVLTGCSTTEITTHRTESTYLRAPEVEEIDFTPLFDGRSLNGWQLLGKKGDGYGVADGILYCAKGGGGNLLTEKEYTDFILRFQFRAQDGANNGLAIRAPLGERALAYDGMELQILDNHGAAHDGKVRRPEQLHGSLYDVAPAKTGALRPAGEWNDQEVTVDGRGIRVMLNGRKILDVDLNTITDPTVIAKHPGLFRESGHIGFLGHNDFVEFRDIRIKELPTARVYNRPARDFELLFDGESLDGWRGISTVGADHGATAQAIAQEAKDIDMQAHWSVTNTTVETLGSGGPIVSAQSFDNVELSVDYRLENDSSGLVILRGLPGVRVQGRGAPDNDLRLGSGGFHDGRFLYAAPKAYGDRFAGAWNRLRVILVGDRAHVFVNDNLVLKNTRFRNSGQPGQPLPGAGAIGLFGENGRIAFRSIQARDLGKGAPNANQKSPAKKKPTPAPKAKREKPKAAESAEPGTMKMRETK